MSRFYQRWRERAKQLVAETTFVEIRRSTRTEITVEKRETIWRVGEYEAGASSECPLCGSSLPHPDVPGTLCPPAPEVQKPRLQRGKQKK